MRGMSKTPATLSTEIAMKANTHSGWFLLVEGDFDQSFWKSRVHPQWHLVNCGGKSNVLGVVQEYLAEERPWHLRTRCVALADRDYDELLGALMTTQPRLAYTDGNDLEMTLLHASDRQNPSVLDRLLEEWIDPNKIQLVRERLRMAAACFGCLRYLNALHAWGVDFVDDGIKIQHQAYFNFRELIIDENQLWGMFATKAGIRATEIETAIESPQLQTWRSGWKLIQAHDFLNLLAVAIKTFRRDDVSLAQSDEKHLQGQIRLTVRPQELQNTSMLQSIEFKAGGLRLLNT